MSAALLEAIRPYLRVVKTAKDGRLVCWCPFHQDGHGKAPHKPDLLVSESGYICHACGEKGPLRKLAEHFGVQVTSESEGFDAVYDYRDEQGELLFQVVRKLGKDFRQRQPDGNGDWTWNVQGVRKVPYRLPELTARPDEAVHIPEGEKDADRLLKLGLLATTNAGGAGKWTKKHHSPFLKGRDVVILPDNDEPGREHRDKLVAALKGVARSIKVVELPDLPEHGDVSDWLNGGGTVEEFRRLAEEAPPVAGATQAEPAAPGGAGSGDSEKDSTAKRIVNLALEAGIELFHDEREEPYARIDTKKGLRTVSVGSRMFKRVLAELAWKGLGKAPGGETLSSVAMTLGAMACLDGEQHNLWVRHAWLDGALWIDLDGSRAIQVTAAGWSIVDEPPILFRTFGHQRALPDPVRGGDPWAIFEFINLHDEDSRTLLKGHLIASFVPNIPVAGIALHGVQGAAKTSLFKVLKQTLDPSAAKTRRSVKDATELAQILFQNRLVVFDNMTALRDWMSDALCGSITGDGWSKRALFTDEDSIYFEYQRVVGIGGINLVVRRADLLDRCVILELQEIPRSKRREETEFWAAFDRARPGILGGLLDLLSRAMAAHPGVVLPGLPRMADHCRWGAAAAVAEGLAPQVFSDAYDRNVGRQIDVALEATPVAEAVLVFMTRQTTWEGSAAALLAELRKVATECDLDTGGKAGWPQAPNWLVHRLKEIEPCLIARGVRVTSSRGKTGRRITLQRVPENCVTAVNCVTEASEAPEWPDSGDAISGAGPSPAVTDCVTRKGPLDGPERPGDAIDASDAIPGTFLDDADLHEDFEERAGIIEFEAWKQRAEAEREARRGASS